MTKKEMFAAVIDNAQTIIATDPELDFGNGISCEDIIAWAEHEIEILSRKRTSSKPTKTQVENEAIKAEILEALGDCEEPVTVKEIMGLTGDKYSSQKISALLRLMGEKGTKQVEKIYDKKVARFALA